MIILQFVVFHWSLNDRKDLQVFKSFLSILADFNYCGQDGLNSSSDFHFPQSHFPSLWGHFQGLQLQLVSASISCLTSFSVLAKYKYFQIILLSFIFRLNALIINTIILKINICWVKCFFMTYWRNFLHI